MDHMQDKEIERAYMEAQRAENMVKYKDEIMSRPKAEWHKSFKEKKDLRKESKKDLKSVGQKFDEALTNSNMSAKQLKLREAKAQRKEEERLRKAAASSMFGVDQEARKKGAGKP